MARKDFYNLSEDERKAILVSLFGNNYSRQEEYDLTIAACGYYGNDVVEVCFGTSTVYINKRTNTDKHSKRWVNSVANKSLNTKKRDFFKGEDKEVRVNDYAIAEVDHEGYNLCVLYYYWKQKEDAA